MEISIERNYGIDLGRIVAINLVIILHVLGRGGLLSNVSPFTVEHSLLYLIEMFAYVAVNLFGLISGYVGLKSKHKYKNIIKLWIQVFFYSMICFFIELGLIYTIGDKTVPANIIYTALFPIICDEFWYFTAYFLLFFFMPLINCIIENVKREYLKILFFILILFVTIFDSIYANESFGINGGYSVLWLAILYGIGAYMKKYDVFNSLSVAKSVLLYFVFILISFIFFIAILYISNAVNGQPNGYDALMDYSNIFVLFASMFLLNAFCRTKVSENGKKVISFVAPLTFGIYIIHLTPICWKYLDGLFVPYLDYNIVVTIIFVLLTVCLIYILCGVIEKLRMVLFKLLKINKLVDYIVLFFDKLYQGILHILHLDNDQEMQELNNVQNLDN